MADNDKDEGVMPDNGGAEAADQQAVDAQPIQALKEERDSLYDRLLRKQAEFDNFRKRAERDRAEYLQFASAEMVRELLNALASFDLAIRNANSDSAASENMLRGFELIYKQIQEIIHEDVPYIFVSGSVGNIAYTKKWQGINPGPWTFYHNIEQFSLAQ